MRFFKEDRAENKEMVSNQCVHMCAFKWDPTKNDDPHTSQENGFSPVCVTMYNFRVDPTENADPQTSRKHGFSPVCVLRCFFLIWSPLKMPTDRLKKKKISLWCVFAYVFSNDHVMRMLIDTR